MTGIEAFVNFEHLDCIFNRFTNLGVSNNLASTELRVWSNQLTILDFSSNAALEGLQYEKNQLTSTC